MSTRVDPWSMFAAGLALGLYAFLLASSLRVLLLLIWQAAQGG